MTESTRPKVSVIIPVYKVENYIGKCVESLFGQTLDEIEYIFVDDASPDASMAKMRRVLERYPHRRSQVREILHKENMGVSQSRQDGVDAAQGEFIIHCDPDDWVEPAMYEKMYETALNMSADIVICGITVENGVVTYSINHQISDDRIECIKKILRGEVHGATWNKLVKSNLYKDRGIKFPEKINLWEDVCVTIPLVWAAQKIVSMKDELYHYRQVNPHAYTRNITIEGLYDIKNSIAYIEGFLHSQGLNVRNALIHRKISAKIFLLNYTSGKTQQEASRLYPEVKSEILKLDISLHSKVGLCLNNACGIRYFRIYSRLKEWVNNLIGRL